MKKKFFTLIELMVVIVVMIILITMSIAAYRTLITGRIVDASAKSVGSRILMARQLASGKHRYVAVLLPGFHTGMQTEKAYSAFNAAYVTYDSGANTYTFDRFVEGSQWRYTMVGCRIMEADDDQGIQNSTAALYPKAPVDDNISVVDNVDLSALGLGTTVDSVRALIFNGAGRVKGDTRYVTIGECNFLGPGKWKVTGVDSLEKNKSCANQITLEVNRFSGSMRYIYPLDY
ncbi:MAG: hypothetical protein HRT89_15780 [Lentisphaeria bacterium]|nr:hypothetical protein [Lentisphaeria bacterium]NQZ69518.1 hypothetical protein [Lentisphaeria bacterium]